MKAKFLFDFQVVSAIGPIKAGRNSPYPVFGKRVSNNVQLFFSFARTLLIIRAFGSPELLVLL